MDQATEKRGEQAERIAAGLRQEIVSGRLAAGSPLRQERIAETYGTSRMPVRDALRLLEAEGLVQMAPNKGATVALLNAAEFREIYEMRGAAEVLALRLAIPELTNRQIERAADIQGAAERSSIKEFGALNKAFHMALYEPCARPRLLAHIAGLNDLADRYLRVAAIELDYVQQSHREHHALLDACRRRDEKGACAILWAHIEDAGRALHALLSPRMQPLR
ncbi:GntR family transcriptional regulator [Nitratireductor sp. ZSWI3]|uniref:GntR family transcriptional regulator n=1 Tax=Nitratireductor sp. ZSWI3 TaxID=2966359 RepID=UPI0021503608|nr:GntR family transcriptional regulator [Nitratireductor sp. ZSWI3]MCR4268465.1 GntR family transcriptional regulator [Nitratireductor sp. ZSWI3]